MIFEPCFDLIYKYWAHNLFIVVQKCCYQRKAELIASNKFKSEYFVTCR